MPEERALIVAAQAATADRVSEELETMGVISHIAFSVSSAKTTLAERQYTILLVFLSGLSDGTNFALETALHTDSAIIVVGNRSALGEKCWRRMRDLGVLFLEKPLNREKLSLVVESALCIHRRIYVLRQENAQLQRKMQEIHSVERAKFRLMQTLGMTEAQAHRFIEKQAMDARQTKSEVALRILRTYENG